MSQCIGKLRNKLEKVHMISKDGMMDFIKCIAKKQLEDTHPFYVLDLGTIERLMEKWYRLLPNIKPFYAVKCNDDPSLLAALASLGANFDCASRGEIDSVLSLGVSPDRIVYANTCKAVGDLKFAAKSLVNFTSFDSKSELEKIKKWHPECDLLLRIRIMNDKSSVYPLGSKFGALPEEIELLLQEARGAGLNVVGVSFHVGSIATDPSIYKEAIHAVKKAFQVANELHMPPMHVIDIGGGFRDGPLFDDIASIIKLAIDEFFGPENNSTGPKLRLIAEPGRFFCETAFTLVTNVIGKRVRGLKREYWINEGMYGSLRFAFDDGTFVRIEPLVWDIAHKVSLFSSSIFGNTCDSADVVMSETQLPEMEMDDLLVFHNMGAYTQSTRTSFNGFSPCSVRTYLAYTEEEEESV